MSQHQEGPLLIYFFPLSPQVEFSLDGRSRQSCLLPARAFNRLDSEEVFRNCSSRDTKTLVAELQTAFKDLDKQCSLSSNPSDSTLDSMGTEESIKEQSGESSSTGMGKRKQSSMPTGTVKKSRVVDDMQDACENCLISSKCQWSFKTIREHLIFAIWPQRIVC